jgi:hypothetical protein
MVESLAPALVHHHKITCEAADALGLLAAMTSSGTVFRQRFRHCERFGASIAAIRISSD